MISRALLVVLLTSCGGGSAALRPLPVPSAAGARAQAIDAAGQRIYRSLVAAAPSTLLIDDIGLRALLRSRAATRFEALRAGTSARLHVHAGDFASLRGTAYGGVCLQGSRLEPQGSPIGLRADGWVFDRALVVGVQPGGRRLASWVDGTFVFTRRGFFALSLQGVESPRWEHADLELASCDMEVGIRHPRPVVGVTH